MKHQSPVNNADLVAGGDTSSVNVIFTVLSRNYDEACLSVSWNLALSRYTGSDGQLYNDLGTYVVYHILWFCNMGFCRIQVGGIIRLEIS